MAQALMLLFVDINTHDGLMYRRMEMYPRFCHIIFFQKFDTRSL